MISDTIETVRHGKAIGEHPVTPTNFGSDYVLPVHTNDLILHRINAFDRDKHIVFHEKEHYYVIKGQIAGQSISSLAHEFETPFNSIFGIRAMQKSKSQAWPRLDYCVNPQRVSLNTMDVKLGVMIYDRRYEITIASICADNTRSLGPQSLINMLISVATKKTSTEHHEFFNFDRELNDDEIKEKWERNGELARNMGTHAHYCMERFFNSLPIDLSYPDSKIGLKFIHDHLVPLGAKAHRTELEIYGEEEDVAGSLDLSVILPNNELFIIDWKRSEKLPKKMIGYSKMKEPLSNLEDCSGCSYALQLGCYRYIIEKYYGFKVKGVALVSLHPDSPFFTPVPYLKKEVEYIMQKRRAYASTRRRLEQDDKYKHLVCCLTGHLAENAVKDTDGNIYWEKAAILHKIENTSYCTKTDSEVKDLLKRETPYPMYPEGLVPWRLQFTGPKSDLLAYS